MSGDVLSAFSKIKVVRVKTTELSHVLPDVESYLAVDTSAVGVGAVLQSFRVLETCFVFFSKS